MDDILSRWIASHLPMVMTWIVGVGAVGLAIKKYGPKIRRFVKIGNEALDIIDTLLDALQDEKVTDEEIKTIIKEVNDFKEATK